MVEELEISSGKDVYRFLLDRAYWSEDPGHVWALRLSDGTFRVGFDHFATSTAGKILFVRVKPAGKEVTQGKSFGTIESGKWVGPLRAPLSGTIAAINEELKQKPELVNDDPYGAGWIAVINPSNFEEETKNKNFIAVGDKKRLRAYIEGDIGKFGG